MKTSANRNSETGKSFIWSTVNNVHVPIICHLNDSVPVEQSRQAESCNCSKLIFRCHFNFQNVPQHLFVPERPNDRNSSLKIWLERPRKTSKAVNAAGQKHQSFGKEECNVHAKHLFSRVE